MGRMSCAASSYKKQGKLHTPPTSTFGIASIARTALSSSCNSGKYSRIAQELLALCGAHTEPSSTGIGVENFVTSLPDAVQNAIAEVTGSAGLPPDRLTMEEKIRIVESLHHAGIFYMKGAVSEVAAQLGSSEATIYRYLSKLK